jgi:hypothetical protein
VIRIHSVPATMAMAEDLSTRLRLADRQEIEAASGMDPAQALIWSVRESKRSDAWMVDGRAAAIAGVATHRQDPSIGLVWMLGSDDADRFPKRLLSGNKQYVKELLKDYRMLSNYVDKRNVKAQRWLKWLGFSLGEPEPFGVSRLPFKPFWMFNTGVLSVTRQDTESDRAMESQIRVEV